MTTAQEVAVPSYTSNERPRFTDHIDLAALRTAVGCSRLFVKCILIKWGASHIVDDASLIVSELATNAVQATGNMDMSPRWSELHDLKLITVRLVGLKDSVVIEVWDTDPTEPVLTEADLEDENGRGLSIIDSLASRWGSYAQPRGKVVWAELPVYARTSNGLPIRPKQDIQPKPLDAFGPQHDPDLLRRVRDGLNDL